jgi:hypothetical protein
MGGPENYVEIWTEKQAMAKHFIHVVNKENLQVRIVASGGFPGFAELNEHVKRLKEKMDKGMNVHILWFGDLDPSGESIDRSTIERLDEVVDWGLNKYAVLHDVEYQLERIAITKEQIFKYNLPWNAERMSEEEQNKLQNDPRTMNHYNEHGQIYACEVDSLPTLYPDEFNNIVVEAVNQYFDKDVNRQGLQKHKERYSEKYVNDSLDYQVREFLEWISMKLKWEWLIHV